MTYCTQHIDQPIKGAVLTCTPQALVPNCCFRIRLWRSGFHLLWVIHKRALWHTSQRLISDWTRRAAWQESPLLLHIYDFAVHSVLLVAIKKMYICCFLFFFFVFWHCGRHDMTKQTNSRSSSYVISCSVKLWLTETLFVIKQAVYSKTVVFGHMCVHANYNTVLCSLLYR